MTIVHVVVFFFKQKTAYEMRISDWSSDVCSSDLPESSEATMSEVPVPRGSTAITEKPSDNRCGMIARHVYQVCGQPPIRRRARPLPPATACTFTLPAASLCDVKCSPRLSGNLPVFTQIGRASGRERVCKDGQISVIDDA